VRVSSVVLTLLALSISGCLFRTPLSKRQRVVLDIWLSCDDCTGHQDSVASIGGKAVPALAYALLKGPPLDRRVIMQKQIEASYERLVEYLTPTLPTVTEAAYVQRFLDNYVATYQSRAAVALHRIGTPAARQVLREGLGQSSLGRADVLRAIGDALGAEIFRQPPDSQVASANSFVFEPPRVTVRDSLGNPLRNVRVTFAIDSGGGVVVDSVKRTDSNGNATVGGWRLGANPGRKTLRVVAAGRVVRFVAVATP
jgi:hypothetical protein